MGGAGSRACAPPAISTQNAKTTDRIIAIPPIREDLILWAISLIWIKSEPNLRQIKAPQFERCSDIDIGGASCARLPFSPAVSRSQR
jgi:hypothetical protein